MTTAEIKFKEPFVRDESAALRGALVIWTSRAIELQAPLNGEPSAIAERAREQQAVLLSRLAAHGVQTIVHEPAEDAPLGALAADAAVIFPTGAFIMRPSDPARRKEMPALESALAHAGITILGRIEAPGLLDGGDVLTAGGKLYFGIAGRRDSEVGIATGLHGNALGREQLAVYARSIGMPVVEVAMSAQARRLRSVASLVETETLLYAPAFVDGAAFAGLRTIEVPSGEDYGAGILALGGRRAIANLRFRETIPLLRRAKITVDAIDLWEFGKVGATPSSLVLALKRG